MWCDVDVFSLGREYSFHLKCGEAETGCHRHVKALPKSAITVILLSLLTVTTFTTTSPSVTKAWTEAKQEESDEHALPDWVVTGFVELSPGGWLTMALEQFNRHSTSRTNHLLLYTLNSATFFASGFGDFGTSQEAATSAVTSPLSSIGACDRFTGEALAGDASKLANTVQIFAAL